MQYIVRDKLQEKHTQKNTTEALVSVRLCDRTRRSGDAGW
jgi:hypothetical protein